MKSNDLWLCECGRVFDDWETYDTLPKYGLEKRVKRGFAGKILTDKNGDPIYSLCHVCQKRSGKKKSPILYYAVIEYARDHEYVTSEMWERFEFASKSSMGSAMHALTKKGLFYTKEKNARPQKYYLTK